MSANRFVFKGSRSPKVAEPTIRVMSGASSVRWLTQVISFISHGMAQPAAAQVMLVDDEPLLAIATARDTEAGRGKQALVHLPSGCCRLAWMTLPQNLRRIADVVAAEPLLLVILQNDDRVVIKELVTRDFPWLYPWLRESERQDKWIDPQSFKEQRR